MPFFSIYLPLQFSCGSTPWLLGDFLFVFWFFACIFVFSCQPWSVLFKCFIKTWVKKHSELQVPLILSQWRKESFLGQSDLRQWLLQGLHLRISCLHGLRSTSIGVPGMVPLPQSWKWKCSLLLLKQVEIPRIQVRFTKKLAILSRKCFQNGIC